MKEHFNKLDYSEESLFNKTEDGKIELQKYYDDLLFYSSFDSTFDAIYNKGDSSATITGTATNEINSVFGQSILLNGSVKYDLNNFYDLIDGNIKFRVKPDFLTGKGYQIFKQEGTPLISSVPVITTEVSKNGGGSLSLIGAQQKYVKYDESNISSMVQIGTIDLDIMFEDNLSNMLFTIGNVGNMNNYISAIYDNEIIYFKIYDQVGNIIVDISFNYANDNKWHRFSFVFDINNGESKVFIDGIQHGITSNGIGTRDNIDTFAIGSFISGYTTNFYVDNFAIYNTVLYNNNFTVSNVAVDITVPNLLVYCDYDTSIDLDFGITGFTTYPISNDYNCKIYVDNVLNPILINLDHSSTLLDIANKIDVLLNNASAIIENNFIKIIADVVGARIRIEEPDVGRSLITLLKGVNESFFPNAPTQDVFLIDLKGVDDKNRISIIHNINSEIYLKMYDLNGVLVVDEKMFDFDNDNITWYAFNFNFNSSIGIFFLDGVLQKIFPTNIVRSNIETDLIINTNNNSYYFDELIIDKYLKETKSFTVNNLALTPYPTTNPYIDIHFGTGFKENEVVDLNLVCSNTSFVVKLENDWFYYFSGSWRTSDGSISQSNEASILETKFSDLYFNENKEVVIRVYFNSDGIENAWIDEIEIKTISPDEIPALITGTIKLDNSVDLSNDSHVLITTDQGSLEVDLSTEAVDVSAVSIQEIKEAIDNASVPGLAPVIIDKNRLVLSSINSGNDALISISNGITSDALDIVWGYETTDSGEEATGTYFDYTEITRYVRSKLGGGIVPVELTDEQIEDCVSEAVYYYNYYRNAKEREIVVNLEGDDKIGYKIPMEVGGEENIIEIIMKPRFPLAYYSGGADNIMNNLYMQWFFNSHTGGGYQNIMGDYYITLSTEKDMENILGTGVKWEFFNNRLFISPTPTHSLTVGIKFKSAVNISEINTNQLIKSYTLALAKQTLGTIRATFGGTIPGGGEMITLRGESLIQEGKQEEEVVLNKMMKLAEPLFLEFI